jgi:hypothetical protein
MMARMDEHMKKMQALHDRMMSAATPEERQSAMQEARKEMQPSVLPPGVESYCITDNNGQEIGQLPSNDFFHSTAGTF